MTPCSVTGTFFWPVIAKDSSRQWRKKKQTRTMTRSASSVTSNFGSSGLLYFVTFPPSSFDSRIVRPLFPHFGGGECVASSSIGVSDLLLIYPHLKGG